MIMWFVIYLPATHVCVKLCVGVHPSSRQDSTGWRWSRSCSAHSSAWRVGISALPEAESCASQWIWI